MKTTSGSLLAVSISLVLVAAGWGETLPDESSAGSAAGDVAGLIQQLDAPAFTERQEASRKLTEAGRAAFPEVEKAAAAGTREVASRAVEILKDHFQGGDDVTKQAAKASLERLAGSGSSSAAQRANEALNPQPEPMLPLGNINGINPALIPLMQQQRLQWGAGNVANVVRRTNVRTVNGKRDIEHQDGDKITKIRDGAGGGIEAEITEKVNGKETTRKIEAKDLDDLKKKDADAARIYEQYGTPGRIQVGALPGGAPAFPPIAAQPAELLKRQIESIDRMIERYKGRLPNDANAQRRLDSLEQMKQRYQDMLPKDAAIPAAAPADKPADDPFAP